MSALVNDEPDSEPMLGMDLPAADRGNGAYRVLARKYRPQRFGELIGQDAMVQTLSNAIRRDRIAHAFLMTGVRGVGKTTTARLIAKGLNCIGADGQGGPTIDPCGQCEPCQAIAEGRHIDVIEMDAASHTGVDDVREIIEAVRYAAVSARYKIYIIDEVHMLSKPAFNALLKTLEEPPAHVKFLFATTEIGKVPITVLSRCQRFDLRRITPDLLFDLFARVCASEQVTADDDALWLIASAAEGSARDGLSILDQAIAHADMGDEGRVTAARVRAMLGLADGGAARALLGAVLTGEPGAAIDGLREQFALGVEPLAIARSLMRLLHGIALVRVARQDDKPLSAEDRAAISGWAGQLGMARIQQLWQLLLQVHEEVARANDPLVALEMGLLRLIHAGDMPDPDRLARLLAEGKAGIVSVAAPAEAAGIGEAFSHSDVSPPPAPPASDEQLTLALLIDRLDAGGRRLLASQLRRSGRLVALEDGLLSLAAGPDWPDADRAALESALCDVMGRRWRVVLADAPGQPSPAEAEAARAASAEAETLAHPLVAEARRIFPEAELIRRTQEDE